MGIEEGSSFRAEIAEGQTEGLQVGKAEEEEVRQGEEEGKEEVEVAQRVQISELRGDKGPQEDKEVEQEAEVAACQTAGRDLRAGDQQEVRMACD